MRAEELGACLAIETGPEPRSFSRKSLIPSAAMPYVNYDPVIHTWPAILALRGGYPYDREAAMREFMPTEGAALWDPISSMSTPKMPLSTRTVPSRVPLGEGWVDWPSFLRYLEEAGFDGYLAIERRLLDPAGDIKAAAEFLRSVRW